MNEVCPLKIRSSSLQHMFTNWAPVMLSGSLNQYLVLYSFLILIHILKERHMCTKAPST